MCQKTHFAGAIAIGPANWATMFLPEADGGFAPKVEFRYHCTNISCLHFCVLIKNATSNSPRIRTLELAADHQAIHAAGQSEFCPASEIGGTFALRIQTKADAGERAGGLWKKLADCGLASRD